jgi:predicted DNA-binding protein (MmcQ/YjbR family)
MIMTVESLREYFLKKPGTEECLPFDDTTLVFKVGGKMFGLLSLDGDLSINLKCDPEIAIGLREEYPAVTPGYHMNKVHWNSVQVDGTIPAKKIEEWIDHSYQLVFDKLPRATRERINKN